MFFLLLDLFGRDLSQKIIRKRTRNPEIELKASEKEMALDKIGATWSASTICPD
jgi:hypothetical protein